VKVDNILPSGSQDDISSSEPDGKIGAFVPRTVFRVNMINGSSITFASDTSGKNMQTFQELESHKTFKVATKDQSRKYLLGCNPDGRLDSKRTKKGTRQDFASSLFRAGNHSRAFSLALSLSPFLKSLTPSTHAFAS